jgi:hypothetical protein
MMADILAIVGSTSFVVPDGLAQAGRIIARELEHRLPDEIVSGGADGVDSLAVLYAVRYDVPYREFIPTLRRWSGPGGFQERNLKIATVCTRLLRISCHGSTTYGSGWTADRAEEMGKPVLRAII